MLTQPTRPFLLFNITSEVIPKSPASLFHENKSICFPLAEVCWAGNPGSRNWGTGVFTGNSHKVAAQSICLKNFLNMLQRCRWCYESPGDHGERDASQRHLPIQNASKSTGLAGFTADMIEVLYEPIPGQSETWEQNVPWGRGGEPFIWQCVSINWLLSSWPVLLPNKK